NFTDALFSLSAAIPDGDQPVYVVDWGMFNSLTLFHQGRLRLASADEFFRTAEPTPLEQQEIERMFAVRGALFVGHVPEREMRPGINQHFNQAALAAGYRKDSVQVISDSNGRPVFEVFQLRK